MALFWRIWAAVSIVAFAVLAIFVGLASLQFDGIYSSLVGERLVVLADRTAAPFQAAARIGLPLATVRNASALLERARQTDDAISAIHVFDPTGRIVHSTEKLPPASIPPAAAAAVDEAGGAPWHAQTNQGFMGGIDIPGRSGKTAGGILVVYPDQANTVQVRAMAAELALAAVLVLSIAAVLSGLLIRLGLYRQIEAFEAIDTTIARFERSAWRSAAGGLPAKAANDETGLGGLLEAAEASYRAAGHAIAAEQSRPP